MAFENYTIEQFMDAMFKGKRDIMDDAEYKTVYTEYIDTAGLYASEEFERVSYIHYVSNRINSVKLEIKLQKQFFDNFGQPYIEHLEFFKKFGHSVYWDDKIEYKKRVENLFEQFRRIELKENKFISTLESKLKELTELRAKKNNKEKTKDQSRGSFIRTLNSLGKLGYRIDNEKTTVEALAWMIKQQTDESKKQ